MKKSVFFVCACSFGIYCFAAEDQDKQTGNIPVDKAKDRRNATRQNGVVGSFEEALVSAFLNNKGWFINQADKKIADIEYTRSKMAFLPSLGANLNLNREKASVDSKDRVSNGLMRTSSDTYQTKKGYNLSLNQNLFNGFQTINTMKANDNNAQSALHKLNNAKATLIVNVLDAYAKVWLAIQNVDARRKMESNLKNILDSQRTKLESGISTPAEVAAAEANFQSAKYNRIQDETALKTAKAEFKQVTGADIAEHIFLPDLYLKVPESEQALMDLALKVNEEILTTRFADKAAKDALKVAYGKLVPSVDASLQFGRNISDGRPLASQYGQTSYSNSYVAQIGVTVPIFANSGSDYSAINVAQQKATQSELQWKDTIEKIRKECIVNWNEYISANAMIAASQASLTSAQLSSDSYQKESELGVRSNTEVWDQENRLLEARMNLAKSKAARLVAAVKISALISQLDLKQLTKNAIK